MKIDLKTLTLIAKYLMLLLILGTIAFIFVNSALPPEESQEQSDAIKDVIVEMLPDESPAEDFVEQYIRKIAHFSEYGLLGIEVAVYILIFMKKRTRFLVLAPFCSILVGFVDESVQIFSKRGPTISDVWIDFGGFMTFYLLALMIFGIARLVYLTVVRRKREAASQN